MKILTPYSHKSPLIKHRLNVSLSGIYWMMLMQRRLLGIHDATNAINYHQPQPGFANQLESVYLSIMISLSWIWNYPFCMLGKKLMSNWMWCSYPKFILMTWWSESSMTTVSQLPKEMTDHTAARWDWSYQRRSIGALFECHWRQLKALLSQNRLTNHYWLNGISILHPWPASGEITIVYYRM